MNIRLAHSSFIVVVIMIWLVAIAGFYISKNSLEDLTIERVNHTAEQRARLYKQIWEGVIYNKLTQFQTVASSPVVVQGVVQPETHTQALRQTLAASLRENVNTTATIVDFEGNPLVEVVQGDKLGDAMTESLHDVLEGKRAFDVQIQNSNGVNSLRFVVPIVRLALDKSWVEGAIIVREPIESVHEQIKPAHQHVDGRLVLATGPAEMFSVGAAANIEETPIEVEIDSTPHTLRYYPQLGLEKRLLNERLSGLALSIGAALAICMAIGYLLIHRLLQHPLASFMEAVETGRKSGSAVPIKSESRISEIRQMTDRYNDMMEEISAKQDELKTLNSSLRIKVLSQSREIATMHAAREKMKFLSGVSHELRTPLHAIMGFTRLGLERSQADELPAIERYFSKVDSNANTLLTLVDDILDLTKTRSNVETESMSPACMFDLVRSVVEETEAYAAEASIAVDFVKCDRDLFVNVDSSRIKQVIRNLLSNAIRYSPAGASINIDIVKRGNQCEARILDVGVGIPPEELESIFDAFTQSSRTDKMAGGTGLGLAISRAIVVNHGGKLQAVNRRNGGACFTISLPLCSRASAAAA